MNPWIGFSVPELFYFRRTRSQEVRTEVNVLPESYSLLHRIMGFPVMLVFMLFMNGCDHKKPKPPPLVEVEATDVVSRTVPNFVDVVGVTESVASVDVRARIKGFLTERAFKDGSDVQLNDLLFVIEKPPYEAALQKAIGRLQHDRAALVYARKQQRRYKGLAKKDLAAQSEYDKWTSEEEKLKASIVEDKAAIIEAELNLSYCTVRAPFPGRIGRRLVDVGNLVGQNEATHLATLVQLDPIYVYFSPPSHALSMLVEKPDGAPPSVSLVMPDNSLYPHPGKLDFVDNVVDNSTATIEMRALLKNPDNQLLPGIYTKVRLFLGKTREALLIPAIALSNDQSGPYVFVVDGDNVASKKNIKRGPVIQGYQVVTKGLSLGERVVVKGTQKITHKMKVKVDFKPSTPPADLGSWGVQDEQIRPRAQNPYEDSR